MNKLLQNCSTLIFRARFLSLAVAITMSLFFGFHASSIRFNFSPENIFLPDDNAYQFYRDTYLKEFSQTGSPCMLAIENTGAKTSLSRTADELFQVLEKNKHVRQIYSATRQPGPQ